MTAFESTSIAGTHKPVRLVSAADSKPFQASTTWQNMGLVSPDMLVDTGTSFPPVVLSAALFVFLAVSSTLGPDVTSECTVVSAAAADAHCTAVGAASALEAADADKCAWRS